MARNPRSRFRTVAVLWVGALLVVAVLIGLIVPVSRPALEDPAGRAPLDDVVAERDALQAAVDEFLLNTDRCPASVDELGVRGPVSPLVVETILGETGAAQCSIRLRLGGPDAGALDGESLWFTRGEDGVWRCGGSMAGASLPAGCRD